MSDPFSTDRIEAGALDVEESEGSIPLEPSPDDRPAPQLNVVELAARRGLGPLSPLGARVWHGEARPCASCGHLIRRAGQTCTECGQDLSDEMLAKMQSHSGPWYVHEHVRPFPGVSLERLIRQIRRGVLTRTTVVRGPTTHHQWRFAAETPVLSKYLGCCWVCQSTVNPTDPICGACGVDLDGGLLSDGTLRSESAGPGSGEIQQLTDAVSSVPDAQRIHGEEPPARLGRLPASWVVGVLAVVTLVAVLAVVKLRSGAPAPAPSVPMDVTETPPVADPAPSQLEPQTGHPGGQPS